MPPRSVWDAESIIEEIKERHAREYDLSLTFIKTNKRALYSEAVRSFGSWRGAIEAAGLDYGTIRMRTGPKGRYKWSRERVISELRALDAQGMMINYDALCISHSGLLLASHQIFGTFAAAVEAAGLNKVRRCKWTDERIINELRDLAGRGVSMRMIDVDAVDHSLVVATVNHYGSFGRAVEAAGLNGPRNKIKKKR